jgi:hypothetical protein
VRVPHFHPDIPGHFPGRVRPCEYMYVEGDCAFWDPTLFLRNGILPPIISLIFVVHVVIFVNLYIFHAT